MDMIAYLKAFKIDEISPKNTFYTEGSLFPNFDTIFSFLWNNIKVQSIDNQFVAL
jgi:hypothetical protein